MLRRITKKIIAEFNSQREEKNRMRAFKENPRLKEIYDLFRNSPEGKWIIGKNDALLLYERIKKYNAKNVLELGGGIGASTAIIALALPNEGKITSVEQFQKCITIANKLTPPDSAKKIMTVYSETHAWQDKNILPYQFFSCYKNLPTEKGHFDFVIIDGPGPWIEDNRWIKLPNGDLFHLIPFLAPKCKIYIDGRKQTLTFYKRFLSPYLLVLEETKKYALLERTDAPCQSFDEIKFFDHELEVRKKFSSYFKDGPTA